MKKLILAALMIVWELSPTLAQGPTKLCIPTSAANTNCVVIWSGNPLPITGSISAESSADATAAAPSYVEGTSNPLSQNLTGDLRTIAKQNGTWNITNISGTVSLPTGASTAAKQPALGVAGTASTDVISVQGIAAMTPLLATLSGTNNIATVTTVTTVASVTAIANALPTGANVIGRVGIDQTTPGTTNLVAAGQNGTWTFQPGNTPNTSPWLFTRIPSTAAGAGIVASATQAAASNSVLSATAKNLYSLTVTIGATSGWVMLFDATSLPGNGATGASMIFCAPVNSDGTKGYLSMSWNTPLRFATGVTAGFSSTACNSITASATAFFYGQVL